MAPDVNNSTADSGVLTIVNNGNQIQTQPLCMSANLHPVDQGGGLDGGGGGARNGRDYKRTNWTVGECLVLQAAKREDYERQSNGGPKEKHKTAAERWQAVEDFCWTHNVQRSGQQCKDRWEKMSADFKKIYDYERHVLNGHMHYWQMTLEEKKVKRLPNTFFQEVYNGLSQWFTRGRGADTGNGNQENLGSLLREPEGKSSFPQLRLCQVGCYESVEYTGPCAALWFCSVDYKVDSLVACCMNRSQGTRTSVFLSNFPRSVFFSVVGIAVVPMCSKLLRVI